MDTVVYTLQLIASQTAGYNIVGNVITSSNTPPSPPPPFKAAQNDIRVNVLWFASLIISLVTASFAMLVKQWLREFLSVDVPSPQARLRLRNFRQPQLEGWMVYEIAASLPLLLQLSLGLFLTGLCYFTAAIHASIGYTTLPLVVGWALFFFTATALPIFFPRRPYRTTLLKTAAARLHLEIKNLAHRVWRRYRHLAASDGSDTLIARGLPHTSRLGTSAFGENLLRCILRRTLPHLLFIPSERSIVKAPDQDIKILVSIDAILSNDELLFTAIAEALYYGNYRDMDVVQFVIQVLAHRLPTVTESERLLPEWPFSDGFPLANLRPQVAEGVIRILFENITTVTLLSDSARSASAFPRNIRNIAQLERVPLLCLCSVIVAAADATVKFISVPPCTRASQPAWTRSGWCTRIQMRWRGE